MVVKITYFVHGTTTDNEKNLATGWNQGKLSQLGIKQSKELRKLIAKKNFDIVFCSDLKRAADSAKLIFENKCDIIQDKRLRECNYGNFNGVSLERIDVLVKSCINKPFPNGESYKDVEKRVVDFIKFLKGNYDGKHVAIVAHRAPQLALDVILKKKTWRQAIVEDWRLKKAWQPGWEYIIK